MIPSCSIVGITVLRLGDVSFKSWPPDLEESDSEFIVYRVVETLLGVANHCVNFIAQ